MFTATLTVTLTATLTITLIVTLTDTLLVTLTVTGPDTDTDTAAATDMVTVDWDVSEVERGETDHEGQGSHAITGAGYTRT